MNQATFWITTTFFAPNGDAYLIPTSLKIFFGTPRFAMYNFAEDRYWYHRGRPGNKQT